MLCQMTANISFFISLNHFSVICIINTAKCVKPNWLKVVRLAGTSRLCSLYFLAPWKLLSLFHDIRKRYVTLMKSYRLKPGSLLIKYNTSGIFMFMCVCVCVRPLASNGLPPPPPPHPLANPSLPPGEIL